MGFASFICHGCPHPLLNSYDRQVHAGNEWMQHGVAVKPDGSRIEGIYDGYGRLIEFESDIEQPVYDDIVGAGIDSTVWHHACWVAAGMPKEYCGPSAFADDQGWFYEAGAHDMDKPAVPEGLTDPTTLIIDGEDDRWALAEQDDKKWKLLERNTDDDRIWTEVARDLDYFDAIAERDKRQAATPSTR